MTQILMTVEGEQTRYAWLCHRTAEKCYALIDSLPCPGAEEAGQKNRKYNWLSLIDLIPAVCSIYTRRLIAAGKAGAVLAWSFSLLSSCPGAEETEQLELGEHLEL
jgi:hypothetical protein